MPQTRPPRPPSPRKRPSARHRAAALRNLEKAWEASRTHWEKTPARMANSRRTIQLAQAALRGRPRRLSPAQLAAVRANMAKARAALNARGRSPEHLSKLRETIKKARAARNAESFRLHGEQILRHGMYARSVRRTMRSLSENLGRLDRRVRLLRRYFSSDSKHEEKLIRALADALWRHERLFYAQADWECRLIDCLLARTPAAEGASATSADALRSRAYRLTIALLDRERYRERDRHMIGSIERLLRRLLRMRLGRDPQFVTSMRIGSDQKEDERAFQLLLGR